MAYVITLEPENKLKSKILSIKRAAKKAVGEQLYIDDVPHISVYLGNFNELNSLKAELSKLASKMKKLKISIDNFFVFENDLVTKKDTFVYTFKDQDKKLLSKVQDKVVKILNPFRTKEILERYQKENESFSSIFKENIDKYGFPFVGNIWIPHMTIASFDKERLNKIKEMLIKSAPKGSFYLDSLVLYEIRGKNEKLYIKKKYRLE
jgi:hypothetical protein